MKVSRERRMINSNRSRVVLGIDFGATNLKALLMDKEGQIYQRFLESSEPERGPDATLNQIIDLAERARKDADSLGLNLTDIGIGTCGLINVKLSNLLYCLAGEMSLWKK